MKIQRRYQDHVERAVSQPINTAGKLKIGSFCCKASLVVMLGLIVTPALGQTAGMLSFQGFIKDNLGNPVNGPVDLEFRIFDAQTLGNQVDMNGDGVVDALDTISVLGVPVTSGILSTKFGPVHPSSFDGNLRWLEVSVGGSPLSRVEMVTAPATAEQMNQPASGTPALRIEPNATSPNIIGGHSDNTVTAGTIGATIGGGGSAGNFNFISGDFGTVGGGNGNTANGDWSTVSGGVNNTASGGLSTVGGGFDNAATGEDSTVGGGSDNTASGGWSTVGGGFDNAATGQDSTVGGGEGNIASGVSSTVPGGLSNLAGGNYSLAAGRRGKANNNGMFVWADSSPWDFPSTTGTLFTPAPKQFLARATGGVVFVSAIDSVTTGDSTAGVQLAAGGGSWSSLSDRNAKANVDKVDGREILQRLRDVPIATWNYRAQDKSIRHIGPMAQDFSAAFGVGEKETMITTIDADGVALAAIQGLYEIVTEKDCEIGELATQNQAQQEVISDLQARLARIEALMVGVNVASRGGVR